MRIPILRLNAQVLVVTLGADINDESVLGFQAELCERTADMQASGVVIDVSAVDIIDSFMARMLNDCAGMLRLLGAQVVLCGMQPAVALTLVEMGRNPVGLVTAFNLERALVRLDRLMASSDHRVPAETGEARDD